MISTFIFILGLIIGSFLNVVILRLNTKDSIVKGSSKCPKCQKKLKWFELIPVLSWFLQLGKCRKCGKKISVQYPLVELGTGFLFVFNFKVWVPAFAGMTLGDRGMTLGDAGMTYWTEVINFLNLGFFVLTTVALSLLVVIFVYDLYHKIIPDVFSFSFGGLSLIFLFFNYFVSVDPSLRWGDVLWHWSDVGFWNLLAPIIFFLPFYLLWRISNGTWIGLGDGKLAFGFGGFLGLVHGLSALVLSFWIGAVFAIGLMLIDRLRSKGKSITMKTEIPFGPFMIIAFLLVYFTKIDVTGISNLLNAF